MTCILGSSFQSPYRPAQSGGHYRREPARPGGKPVTIDVERYRREEGPRRFCLPGLPAAYRITTGTKARCAAGASAEYVIVNRGRSATVAFSRLSKRRAAPLPLSSPSTSQP